MSAEQIFKNARIVLRDEIIEGTVQLNGTQIADVSSGTTSVSGASDLEGDYLMPGLIEMHTDHMEKHMVPRPGVHWPDPVAAALAHDVQVAGAGITTVYDAISVGTYREGSVRKAILQRAIDAVNDGKAKDVFRADHLIHLRCEVSDPDLVDLAEDFIDLPNVALVSVMDHTPGQRQWRDLSKMKQFHSADDMSDDALQAYVQERVELQAQYASAHRHAVVQMCQQRGLPMASHDDTTPEHVREAVADGIVISEFPTTREAAEAAREKGMMIIMGAPNVVRGGSHSGNVSAIDLAEAGLLDGLSSDYVPSSLLQAVFQLNGRIDLPIPEGVATVSANIAEAVGLDDRGEIAPDRRADLIRVKAIEDMPVVREVWREGRRVV
ncbi:MAG: alpha-D-ribose 1-methylphosphonate 5-triphosphate diphosphatase [Alphaproteobacteria bacterium]|nr:alpha-D-ribose 1-methylphosphonate 5-triphosphate diphosphatase [Alphaproteobacteria bacterium]